MRFVDRSRVEADWFCPRSRYLGFEIGGRGITTKGIGFDLQFGTAAHNGIEAAVLQAAGQPYVPINLDIEAQTRAIVAAQGGEVVQGLEWGAIGVGLVHGFMRSVWPVLMEEYELVSVEREVTLMLAEDVMFQARPDLLLRNRATKGLWYFELKTTGSIDAQWVQSWSKAPQVQLGALACEQEFGEALEGVRVIGLYKGRKSTYNGVTRQSSPFAWGWRTVDQPGILAPQFSYEEQRRKGWERFLATEYPGGAAGWVADMPAELLARQFVVTDPLFLRRDMTDELLEQMRDREAEIAKFAEEQTSDAVDRRALNHTFRQHFFNCTPAWGRSCAFCDACWIPWVKQNPLASGLFEWRTPHHEAERKFFELKEVA